MSGIQNLLKYRFNKKEPEKIPTTPTSPVEDRPIVVKRRGAQRIMSDSEESPVKATTSHSSASCSPWLSKEKGITNGFGISRTQSSLSSSQSSSFTGAASSQDTVIYSHEEVVDLDDVDSEVNKDDYDEREREIMINVNNLQEMFPNTAKQVIEDAVYRTDTFDEAVDFVINYNKSVAVKRKFSRIRTIDSDDELTPAKKKPRPILDSSQETIIIDDEAQTNGTTAPKTFDEKVEFLLEAFPFIPKKLVKSTLRDQDGDIELASVALGTMSPEKNPQNGTALKSPTVSMGSIKAIKAARTMNKLTGNIHRDYDDDDDFVPAKGIGAKVKMKKSNGSDDDYSDDDDDFDSDEEGGERMAPIVEFFNKAMSDELMSMQGCSRKKADSIMEIRPFEDWGDLVAKIEQSKDLTYQLITSCKEVLRIRSVVAKLMNNCKKIAKDMETIITDITSKTVLDEQDTEKGYIAQQPDILNKEMTLKPYQMIGLNWLILMHDQELNGILGDEMGLGKTIQTVAFLAYLLEVGIPGPHVVVVPSSTLDNWLRELQLWCPDLKVMLYYGSQEDRREVRAQISDGTHEEFHVVMTTYNMASGSNEDRALFKKLKFNYAIFDEGHMLKNMSSMRYQSLMKIRASRRLLLTGTPLQNNLVELMSLLAFVMPDLFEGKTDHVKRIFTSISSKTHYEAKGNYEKEVIGNAKNILKPFFLRRLKTDVLKQLPDKTDLIEKVAMVDDQQDLYDGLRTKFSDAVRNAGGQAIQGQAGSAMMMQLRKAANHPLLHRQHYTDKLIRQMAKIYSKDPSHPDATADYVYEDMEVMSDFELHRLCGEQPCLRKFRLEQETITTSGKFRYLDKLLIRLKQKDDRVLLFSQFTMVMDIMVEYMKARKYKYLRLDGQTPVQERQDLIDKFNKDKEIFVFLLSTKAGGLGINLTSANAVVLHDIDFNPYNDKQAEDRCHRVGQTRDVTVYRLISKNTIEEAMLRCAQAKLRLEQDVTGQGKDEGEDPSNVASLLKEALAIGHE